METLFIFGLGLIVGWNFLPQPEFVKNMVVLLKEKYFSK